MAAAILFSKATARGTQYPPWLMPWIAIFFGSTPGRLRAKSTTGVMTFSQSGGS